VVNLHWSLVEATSDTTFLPFRNS